MLDKTNTIDWLGIEKSTGHVLLTLVDEADWMHEHAHLHRLQEKLHTYVSAIESGEAFRQVSEMREVVPIHPRTPVRIAVIFRYEPTEQGSEFLEYIQSALARQKIGFTHTIVRDGESGDSGEP